MTHKLWQACFSTFIWNLESCFVSILRKLSSIDGNSMDVLIGDLTGSISLVFKRAIPIGWPIKRQHQKNHKSEPDINGFIAVVRPVPDILAYRNRFMDFMFEGLEFPTFENFLKFLREFHLNFEKDIHRQIIEFQALDMRYQKPDVIERTDIGFPQGLGGVSNWYFGLWLVHMRLQPIGRITPLDGVNLKPFLDNKTLCTNHSFFRLRAANTSPVRGWIFFWFSSSQARKFPKLFCWSESLRKLWNMLDQHCWSWSEQVQDFHLLLVPVRVGPDFLKISWPWFGPVLGTNRFWFLDPWIKSHAFVHVSIWLRWWSVTVFHYVMW